MSRRDVVKMTDEEIDEYLDGPHNCTLASIGPEGFPHLTAMWYAIIDGKFHFATYGRSQKVRNLERNPKCSVLVEDGESYDKLRGVAIDGEAELIADPEFAGDVLLAVQGRYTGIDLASLPDEVEQGIRDMARKRTVVVVHPHRTNSWDHRKLGGVY